MNKLELQAAIETEFKKVFPNGHFHASNHCLGTGFHFSLGLIGNIDDCPYRIRNNDPLTANFNIHDCYDREGNMIGDKITVECAAIAVYRNIDPTNEKEKYLAQSTNRVRYRKINNTPEKAVKALAKKFVEIRNEVKNIENGLGFYTTVPSVYLDI